MTPDDQHEPTPVLRQAVAIGGVAIGSIVLGVLLGLWLDSALGTDPVLTLCGLAVGIVGAGLLSWYRIRPILRSNGPRANWGPETYDEDDDDN